MTPIKDKIIVKYIEPEQKSKGGIILTGEKKQKQIATFVSVGPKAGIVSVGQTVVLAQYAGTPIEDGLFIASVADVLAVVDD